MPKIKPNRITYTHTQRKHQHRPLSLATVAVLTPQGANLIILLFACTMRFRRFSLHFHFLENSILMFEIRLHQRDAHCTIIVLSNHTGEKRIKANSCPKSPKRDAINHPPSAKSSVKFVVLGLGRSRGVNKRTKSNWKVRFFR